MAQETFTAAVPGDLEGSLRFKALAATLTLAPGNYSLVSCGWTGNDRYTTRSGPSGARHSGEIRLFGPGRFSASAGVFPTSSSGSSDPGYYSGAANFRYVRAGQTLTTQPAVRFDGTDDGLKGLATLDIQRPSTVYIAYEQDDADTGYIIQNSASPIWREFRRRGAQRAARLATAVGRGSQQRRYWHRPVRQRRGLDA